MLAAQFSAINQLDVRDVSDPTPAPDEVVVRVKAAALNHRDVWIKSGQYAGLKFPIVPGSDGAGVIESAGSAVGGTCVGDEVIINPSFNWGADEDAQGDGFSILGLPQNGTLGERLAVPATQLSPKPAHLSWEEAAALPLAGLTAYRALFTRAQLKPQEKVLISGIGGGVALFALQFAVAHGAQVWVTSSQDEKISRATTLGAQGGFNYGADGWAAAAAKEIGGFDVIVDSAGGDGFEHLIDLAAAGGRITVYGATRGNPPVLPMRKVFWRQVSLLGSTMGSPRDWSAMMEFVARNRIAPVISEVFPIARAADAFGLMERGEQFGKIVLTF
jgi:zinc-binding alcohol dehydrogenase/oxidoreductase